MKKILPLLFLFVSCTSAPVVPKLSYIEGKEYLGVWAGEVLVVNVEATFTEKTYQFKTIASNGVWFSGTRGEYIQTKADEFLVKQTDGYVYDDQTGIGTWVPVDPKVFPMEWHFDPEHSALVLSPNRSEMSLVLFRIK